MFPFRSQVEVDRTMRPVRPESQKVDAVPGCIFALLSSLGPTSFLKMVDAGMSDRVETTDRVKAILASVKVLAAEYYQLTGKPLGVTGEVAEFVASELLGLELVPPRTPGFDALRATETGACERIQIKGRAFDPATRRNQRIGTIKREGPCDVVMLVLLDSASLDPVEIWEAPFGSVVARLDEPGSKSRNERGALAVSDFKRLGTKIWPAQQGPSSMLYFAYGSNLDPEQMKERCPDAVVVGIGYVADHSLCFPRRSRKRGCGVSSIERQAGQCVWGAVYRLSPSDLAELDKSEGFREDRPSEQNSYDRVSVPVVIGEQVSNALTYVARREESAPLPNAAYLTQIMVGARHHGLPGDYLRYLESLQHD